MTHGASGGSQPRNDEGASHFARRGKNAEAFLISVSVEAGDLSGYGQVPRLRVVAYSNTMGYSLIISGRSCGTAL